MSGWTTVASWQRLQTQGRALARVAGFELAIFHIEGQAFAIEDSCPHAGASLCLGALSGSTVQCRAHGLRFDVRTGAQPGCPEALKVRVFPLRITGDEVLAHLPDNS